MFYLKNLDYKLFFIICYIFLQFISQQREIDDYKEEINRFKFEVFKLNGEKEKMKKDIQGFCKEIVERDDIIQDKVRL